MTGKHCKKAPCEDRRGKGHETTETEVGRCSRMPGNTRFPANHKELEETLRKHSQEARKKTFPYMLSRKHGSMET